MTSYFSYRVKLIGNQKSKLADAIQNKSAVTLRLPNDELSGSDQLTLTKTQMNKIKKISVIW